MQMSEGEKIKRNLIDAGCDENMIVDFFNIYSEKQLEKELLLLSNHRKNLLTFIHEKQKQIDCLDYLMTKLEKSK